MRKGFGKVYLNLHKLFFSARNLEVSYDCHICFAHLRSAPVGSGRAPLENFAAEKFSNTIFSANWESLCKIYENRL